MRLFLVRLLGRPFATIDPPQVADAIVVLGAVLGLDGSVTPILDERIRAGVAAWRDGLAPLLVLAGGRSPFASHAALEAHAMAARARTLGVPDSALLIEDESASTWENAQRCAALLLPRDIRRIWIVTQPFHLRRAMRHFRRAGFDPLGFGITGSLQFRDPGWGLARVLR